MMETGLKTHSCRHISQAIARSPAEVYAFASDPANLPKWAEGLSRSEMKRAGEEWIADSPMGEVRVKFAPKNVFGVMDHDVVLPNGETFHNPFRVLANGEGSEVVFTLYRHEGVSDQDFESDAARIKADLATLKKLLS